MLRPVPRPRQPDRRGGHLVWAGRRRQGSCISSLSLRTTTRPALTSRLPSGEAGRLGSARAGAARIHLCASPDGADGGACSGAVVAAEQSEGDRRAHPRLCEPVARRPHAPASVRAAGAGGQHAGGGGSAEGEGREHGDGGRRERDGRECGGWVRRARERARYVARRRRRHLNRLKLPLADCDSGACCARLPHSVLGPARNLRSGARMNASSCPVMTHSSDKR